MTLWWDERFDKTESEVNIVQLEYSADESILCSAMGGNAALPKLLWDFLFMFD